MGSCDGKVAFITGASRGIGRAIARRLASEGAAVVVCASRMGSHDDLKGTLEEAASEIQAAGGKAFAIAADLSVASARSDLVARASEPFGSVDILVNNAAGATMKLPSQVTTEERSWMYEMNLNAPIDLAQQAIPGMRERGSGWILNISSSSANQPVVPYRDSRISAHVITAYGATKAALNRYTKGLAHELAEHDIFVNAMAPRDIVLTSAAEYVRDIGRRNPDMVEPVEMMAEAALELCTGRHVGRVVLSREILHEVARKVRSLDGKKILGDAFLAGDVRSPQRVGMLYYFDFHNYSKMVRLAWNEKVPKARYYYLAVLCLAVPIVSAFHAICFFLDGILFPGLFRIDVREPVFLVGHARSGTTLTHRLLSKDQGRFSSFLLYELYFPSLLQKKLIRFAAAVDERFLGSFVEKRVRRWEGWRYASQRDAHKMGLTEPEEDDIIFYYSMASGFWITKMPYMGDLDFYHVDDWPEAKRRRLFGFYRDCVRRQLYLNGSLKIHLSKNPIFAGRVASIIESFPDAKIVVNVRDPNETIPSLLKLVRGGWKMLGWDEERQDRCLRVLANQSWHSYRHPLEVLEANPGTKGAVVDYRDLVTDPAATIERAYEDLGLPMTDGYREVLLGEGKRAGQHKTSHSYSLEEFGLEADEIRSQLADLFDRFQWDAEEAPPAVPAEGETQ